MTQYTGKDGSMPPPQNFDDVSWTWIACFALGAVVIGGMTFIILSLYDWKPRWPKTKAKMLAPSA